MGQLYQCTGIAFPTTSFCQSCQPGSVHWIIPDDGSLDNSFCTVVRLQTSGLREFKLWANRATSLSFKVIPVKPLLLCPYRINVDSMKMSDHVEFVAPQISDLAEPMGKRMLEGIPLTWSWTQHDMPSLHELIQRSMEPFDPQPTCEVASSNDHYIHFRDTDGTWNQPMGSNLLALLTWITVLGSRSKMLSLVSITIIVQTGQYISFFSWFYWGSNFWT